MPQVFRKPALIILNVSPPETGTGTGLSFPGDVPNLLIREGKAVIVP
jgi:hypothetical protein